MPNPRELSQRKRRAQSQNTQSVFAPAFQGGINSLIAAGSVPPQDALFMYNMIPQEYGTAVRRGYTEHCQPVPVGTGVRTVIPFNVQVAGSNPADKLFVVTSDGIYDATVAGALPTKVLDWPVKAHPAGYCSWHTYATVAGQFLLVCDLVNGYYVYTASTNTWAVGSITGPDPAEATLDFVTVWKNRVWFIQRDTSVAWYLPVGQIGGAATKFEFGNKFKYGGWLKSIWNWTLDAGEGVDDYLVALGSAGDMVVYKGTDPSVGTNFNMVGWWYIGKSVQGRRQGDDMGGELLVLSTYGILQLSKLISGLPVTDEGASISYKINPRLSTFMDRTSNEFGWQIRLFARGQLIFVTTPKEVGKPWMQFVYSTTTRAWSQFLDLPMVSCDSWRGGFFFGTDDNRVMQYTGFSDKVLLADAGESAEAIEWELLSGYQLYTQAPVFKRVHFLRPQFIGTTTPTFAVKASYDFDLQGAASSPPYVDPATGVWNTGAWDVAYWSGGAIVNQPPRGASGLGRHIAIAMRGHSASECIHIGTDVLFDSGGML
jgi:hypothetical protein